MSSAVNDPQDLQRLYRIRFGGDVGAKTRQVTWQVLCDDWFPQFIAPTDTVLELGAGGCEFINNVKAKRRIAVDLNPDVAAAVGGDVEFLEQSASDISQLQDGTVDVVFSSNFFEHLGTASTLLEVLAEAHRVLRPGGTIITLMPNLAALGPRYFDFLDHTLPLTDSSVVEALTISGFRVDKVIPRFLPYTASKMRKPVQPFKVRWYLKTPVLWRVMGKQLFIVAAKV